MMSHENQPPNLSIGKPADAGDFILERRHRLVKRFAPTSGGTLLDFGCGNGAQTLLFEGDFETAIGVDIEKPFIDAFREEVLRRGLVDRVRPIEYDGIVLPIDSESVDGAISFEVLEHVQDESSSLLEVLRVLKPGGWFAISVPNRWWVFETHGARLPLLPWNRVPFFSWLPKKIHDRWARARIYRRREIVSLLRSRGFEVTDSVYVTAPMDVVKWRPLRDLLRRTLFCGDTTPIPFMATAVLVLARKRQT